MCFLEEQIVSFYFFNFSQLRLRLFVGIDCVLFALKRHVCLTTTGAELCTADVLESATAERLNTASLIINFPKEQQMSVVLLQCLSCCCLKPAV